MADMIEVGGRKFELCFNRYSIYLLKRETGIDFASLFSTDCKIDAAPLLIWSCVSPKCSIPFEEFCGLLPMKTDEFEPIIKATLSVIQNATQSTEAKAEQ